MIAPALARISAGDTAWMLAATALVLLMTPALGLFYAGLVRSKNTLNTFMMSIAALAVATITWALVGYSLAFDEGNGFVGGLGHAFLSGVTFTPRAGTAIPELVFFVFQAAFCIVTTALVSGAVVERIRFAAAADRVGDAATGERTRRGAGHGCGSARRGGLRHGRGGDPGLNRGRSRGAGPAGTALTL